METLAEQRILIIIVGLIVFVGLGLAFRDRLGMTFALETQHGKRFRYGVRIEEMLIVHEKEIEIISNFPVKQITVVDPIPGYGDHVK